MRILLVVLISAFVSAQEPPASVEQLVERLRSTKAEERSQAEKALILRGAEALPAVRKAAEDPDAEVSARARAILDAIAPLAALTPALEKAMPGSRVKLASGAPHAWTEIFLEAVKQEGGKRSHPELGREDFLPLARLAVKGATKTEVASVCGAVAAWRLRTAAPELVSHFDEQDWNIRQYVFDAVESCRARELAPALLERMHREQGGLKSMWLGVLARTGCPEAGPEILAALAGAAGAPGGGEMYDWAAQLDLYDAVPGMVRLLQAGHLSLHEVLSALSRLAPDEVPAAIRSALGSPESARKIGGLTLIAQYYSSRIFLPDVLKLLEDPDPAVRTQALTTLGAFRMREQLPEIRKRLEDPALSVRRAAAGILAGYGDKGGMPEFLMMLGNPQTRTGALWSIRLLGAREAIPDILPLLGDPEAKAAAAEALAALGVEEARSAILELLQSSKPEERGAGAVSLATLDGAKAIPRLLPLLDDPDFNLQHNTGPQLLHFLKAKKAVPKFREWALSPDPSLRHSGLWYLSAISPEDAVPILMKLLQGSDPFLGGMAADQLARMKRADALPLMRGLLTHSHAQVRRAAASALVQMGDRAGAPLVMAGNLYTAGRFELNLLRNPEVCRKWKDLKLSGPAITGSNREILEEVTRRTGITLEAPADLAWPAWVNEHAIDGRDLLSVVSGVAWGTGGAVVEEGRLRILALREGHRFWTRWWAEELRKSTAKEDQEEGETLLAALDASDIRFKAWTKDRAAATLAAPKPDDLRSMLTDRLKAVPGLEERLVKGSDADWTKVFAEVHYGYGRDQYKGLKIDDLEVLAPRALQGAVTAPDMVQTLQAVAVHRLRGVLVQVVALLKSPIPEVRVTAARACLAIEGSKAMPRVLPLLEDPDPAVRTGTVGALATERRREGNARLVALMDDPAIRAGLVEAAGPLEITEAVPILLEKMRLSGFDGYRARQVALQSLWVVGGPEHGREVAAVIRTEFDAYVFSLIFRCLSTWGTREAIPDVLWFLDNPGRFGGPEIPTAFVTLKALGAKEAGPAILKKLTAEPPLRGVAVAAAEMDLKEAIPTIRTLLGSTDHQRLVDAAHALGVFGDRESLPALRKLLGHSDASVRTQAAIALGRLHDHESLAAIVAVTRDREGGYRDELTPLMYLGSPEAKKEFLVNFKTHSHQASPEMVRLFGEELLPSLLPALRSGDAGTRRNALYAAGTIPGEVMLGELRRMLQDPYDDARRSAAEMLCRRGVRDGVPLVLDNVHDQYRSLPFELNAVREPEAWRRLGQKELTQPLYASARDLVARIAKEAGLAFEEPPADHPYRSTWVNVHVRLQEWGRALTLLDGLERLRHRHWMVIVEKDKLRIVPRREALDFWNQWWDKENR